MAPSNSLKARVVIPLENIQLVPDSELISARRPTSDLERRVSGVRKEAILMAARANPAKVGGPLPKPRWDVISRRLYNAMVRLIFDIFGQTLRTLWAHKLRSFLTMFGIAWGVGSLLLLVGLGEGFRSGNRKQFDSHWRERDVHLVRTSPGHAGQLHRASPVLSHLPRLRRHSARLPQRWPQQRPSSPAAISAPSVTSTRPAARSPAFRRCSTRSVTCRSMKAAGSTSWTTRKNAR